MICLVRIAGSIMFVWCNGIYHVCLVYCFDFCSILSYSHYAIYHFMGLYNFRDCLMYRFGVCLVYRLRLSWSYSIVWCTICLFGVPFTSVVVILECVVYHVCLVYHLRLSWSYSNVWHTMCLFGIPFTSVVVILECVVYHVCLVYHLRLSWSYSNVWHTMCLFGVPFTSVVVILDCMVYHVFVWCTVSSVVVILDCMVYHVFVWCTVYVCRGHTRMCGIPCVCLVYRLRLSWSYSIVWCTMCLFGVPFRLSWSYSIVWCTMCLFGVPFTSVVVILDCMVYHVFVWCTVYVCRGHTRLYGVPCVCLVYRFVCRGHTRLYGVPCVCLVYRLRLSWSYSIVWCTMCLFGVPFTSVVVILDCVVYHMFVCVPFTFDMVTLDGGVYHMFVCVPFTFCRGYT